MATPGTTQKATLMQDIIAGGIAGSAGIVVGHPFDTIKVRMQMGSAISGSNLFRGIGAPVTMAALVNATIFSSFGYNARIWDEYFPQAPRLWKNVAGGAVAGVVSSFLLCPSEHIKVRLQSQKGVYRHTIDALVNIVKSHGLVGLYRGLFATMTRQVPGFGVYFGAFDPIKEQCRTWGVEQDWLACILAGGTAGSLSWATVYPTDLIKSRIQNLPLDATRAERSMLNVARRVVQENGIRSLYRGLGITVLRAFPVNGIIFCVYELSLTKLLGSHTFASCDHMTPEMI